jgi:hypothetical protein
VIVMASKNKHEAFCTAFTRTDDQSTRHKIIISGTLENIKSLVEADDKATNESDEIPPQTKAMEI